MEKIKSEHSLSNAVRERLIADGHTKTALVCDALYFVRAIPFKLYSVQDVVTMTKHLAVSDKVIREGLSHPIFRTELQPTAGRSRVLYRLPSPRQVRDFLMLYDHSEQSDILPVAAFECVSAYKTHLHVSMVARLTQQNKGLFKMAREKMARRLNVTINTIRNYERKAAIYVQHHITSMQIICGVSWHLPVKNENRFSEWLLIAKPDGTERNYPLVQAIAAQALSQGCKVFKMRQHSNYYEFTGDFFLYGLVPITPSV